MPSVPPEFDVTERTQGVHDRLMNESRMYRRAVEEGNVALGSTILSQEIESIRHADYPLGRMFRNAERAAQKNGLTFMPGEWVSGKHGAWYNFSGTCMLELDPNSGTVSFWKRERYGYADANKDTPEGERA
jgi:hypothetical protein